MSRHLRTLLNDHSHAMRDALEELERVTGNDGLDVRIYADALQRAHGIMRRVGLDPSDSLAHEVYHALNAHAESPKLFDDTDHVGLLIEGEVVSFNIDDIQKNRGRSFDQRDLQTMQNALKKRIARVYHLNKDVHSDRTQEKLKKVDLDYDAAVKPDKDKGENRQKPYILCVGDMVSDAFIKLKDDQAKVITDKKGNKHLVMPFGNKPPYDSAEVINAVGNSANAAVACARLGVDAGLMAWCGDDQPGKDSLHYLTKEGVDTTSVVVNKSMKSHYHYVLRYKADRTILIKYEPYRYVWKAPERTPDWLYVSALSNDTWELHQDILRYLDAHPKTKLAFQPGTYHFEWGAKKLAEFYKRAEIVFLNREEAALVIEKETRNVEKLAKGLHDLGVKIAIITDGPDGSYASNGNTILYMPNYPDPKKPLDRTGAGDAFASTITAALMAGESLETALAWAPINSMSVVQKLGAQAGLLNKAWITRHLHKAPKDYVQKKI